MSDRQHADEVLTVCVIIPCYKNTGTLRRAIESVLLQTRAVDEIIVINDCSPESDEIEKILIEYPQVIYKKNKNNFGLAASRNIGVKNSSSEIISFLDADDELHPQKIELQLSLLSERTFVSCDLKLISDYERNILSKSYSIKPRYEIISVNSWLLFHNYITGASLMAYKQLLLDLGGYDESLRSCEDFDLWLRIVSSGFVVKNINHPLYYYHYNPDSLSNNLVSTSFWEMQVILNYFSRVNKSTYESIWASFILFTWIIRHSIRLESCGDEVLNRQIKNEMQYLSNYPVFKVLLKCMKFTGVLKIVAFIKSRKL